MPTELARRTLLATAALAPLVVVTRPAHATPANVQAAMRALFGDAMPRPGRVSLDVPTLVDNGNLVAVTVGVDGPHSGPERVVGLHLFADGNPLPNVANFHLGPGSARAQVSARIRLAGTQTVIGVAKLADGSLWSDSVDVLVTISACIE